MDINAAIADFERIKEQMEEMEPLTFGSEINVLLITDRLQGCACGLQAFFQNSTDITVDLVNTLEEVAHEVKQKPIDFLIIVGYLQDKELYRAIWLFESLNRCSITIMYAKRSVLTDFECQKYGVSWLYDRHEPVAGFFSFMQERYAEASARMSMNFPNGKTRIQLWTDEATAMERIAREKARKNEELRKLEEKKARKKNIWSLVAVAALIVVALLFVFFQNGGGFYSI